MRSCVGQVELRVYVLHIPYHREALTALDACNLQLYRWIVHFLSGAMSRHPQTRVSLEEAAASCLPERIVGEWRLS